MDKLKLKLLLEKAIQTSAEKEKKAFHTYLYQAYFDLLYTIVKNRFPNNAEDTFSDLFCYKLLILPLSIYKDSFEHLDQFLIRCTINFCNTAYKRKQNKKLLKKIYGWQKERDHPYIALRATEIMLDLKHILQNIPPRQEKVFMLHCYLGYRHIEIVDLCKDIASESISKQLLYRAKKNLQRYLLAH